jgi:hypothetical protein
MAAFYANYFVPLAGSGSTSMIEAVVGARDLTALFS